MDLGVFRRLVGVIDTGKVLYFSRTSFLIEAFWVSFLCLSESAVDKHLNERHASFFMQGADLVAVLAIRADEAGQCDDTRIYEEFGDLANAPNIFGSILGCKS